jgi:SAM-dependent methyltransferase
MLQIKKYLYSPLVPLKGILFKTLTDKTNLPGIEFENFGKGIGKEILKKGIFSPQLLFNPVSIVRYFEFDFVNKCIGNIDDKTIWDISSPFLFGFYSAKRFKVNYNYINPDKKDLDHVKNISQRINLKGNYTTSPGNALKIEASDNSLDGIISISVIEHIIDDGDTLFIKEAERVLKPGGFLALTFPVSNKFEIEYREEDIYGLNHKKRNGKYFFQRIYDENAINERLLNVLPSIKVFEKKIFGEKEKNFYAGYQKRWLKYGLFETVKDAYYISKNFKYFNSISELPGIGVIGIILRKEK